MQYPGQHQQCDDCLFWGSAVICAVCVAILQNLVFIYISIYQYQYISISSECVCGRGREWEGESCYLFIKCAARCRIRRRFCLSPAVSQRVTHRSKVLVLVLELNFLAGGNWSSLKQLSVCCGGCGMHLDFGCNLLLSSLQEDSVMWSKA